MILKFLIELSLPLHSDVANVVSVRRDRSCRMAEVLVNRDLLMAGNEWDFHPGCHGFPFDFYGADELADKVARAIRRGGMKAKIVHGNYHYR